MGIKLVYPAVDREEAVMDYKMEHQKYGETEISGSAHLGQMESFEEWLSFINRNRAAETVDPNWVVSEVFLAVDDNDRIIGIIDLRYYLNKMLEEYGHCGYSVRPTERGKGYAAEMLRQVKEKAKAAGMEVLHMATFQDNYPSVYTIRKNGGIWAWSFTAEGRMADMYKIYL